MGATSGSLKAFAVSGGTLAPSSGIRMSAPIPPACARIETAALFAGVSENCSGNGSRRRRSRESDFMGGSSSWCRRPAWAPPFDHKTLDPGLLLAHDARVARYSKVRVNVLST